MVTTVLRFLQVKYAKQTPSTVCRVDAEILGVEFPTQASWLKRHGDRVLSGVQLECLKVATLRRWAKEKARSGKHLDIFAEHLERVAQEFGYPDDPQETQKEPTVVVVASSAKPQRPPALQAKLTKKQRRALKRQRQSERNASIHKPGIVTITRHVAVKATPAHRPNQPGPYVMQLMDGPVDVKSGDFLQTFEWRRLRMDALKLHGARCQCCGDTPANGAIMNVDHIHPRKLRPDMALSLDNLQILCGACNHGKGNGEAIDWRPSARGAIPEHEWESVVMARSL